MNNHSSNDIKIIDQFNTRYYQSLSKQGKPQQACYDASNNDITRFYVSFEQSIHNESDTASSTRVYGSYANIDEFLTVYNTLSNTDKRFYEQIRYARVEHYDFDFKYEDFVNKYHTHCIDKYILNFLFVGRRFIQQSKWKMPTLPYKIYVSESTKQAQNKISFHIVIRSCDEHSFNLLL